MGHFAPMFQNKPSVVPYPTELLSGHSQPNPTHVEYTNIVVKKFLH